MNYDPFASNGPLLPQRTAPPPVTSTPSSPSLFSIPMIDPTARANYDNLFYQVTRSTNGLLAGGAAKDFFSKASLPNPTLAQIWFLSDIDKSGSLDRDEFAVAYHLCLAARNGINLPAELPRHLVPPSKMIYFQSTATRVEDWVNVQNNVNVSTQANSTATLQPVLSLSAAPAPSAYQPTPLRPQQPTLTPQSSFTAPTTLQPTYYSPSQPGHVQYIQQQQQQLQQLQFQQHQQQQQILQQQHLLQQQQNILQQQQQLSSNSFFAPQASSQPPPPYSQQSQSTTNLYSQQPLAPSTLSPLPSTPLSPPKPRPQSAIDFNQQPIQPQRQRSSSNTQAESPLLSAGYFNIPKQPSFTSQPPRQASSSTITNPFTSQSQFATDSFSSPSDSSDPFGSGTNTGSSGLVFVPPPMEVKTRDVDASNTFVTGPATSFEQRIAFTADISSAMKKQREKSERSTGNLF